MEPSMKNIFKWKILSGNELPSAFFELRESVYGKEKEYFPLGQTFDSNDIAGQHLLVYDSNDQLVGSKFMIEAELSDFSEYSGISTDALTHCFVSGRGVVVPEHRNSGLFAYMLNIGCRYFLSKGRTTLLTYCEPGEIPAKKILNYSLIKNAHPRVVTGGSNRQYTVYPYECRTEDAIIRSFSKLDDSKKQSIIDSFYVDEIVDLVRSRTQLFYDNPFFNAVETNTLSISQYSYCLSNLHQFVRWTTRILGAAVAMSEDPNIRAHFADHLSGEVNHELWLEDDIRHLNGDVDYVKNSMVPCTGTLSFMFTQEALAGWRNDPVLFMGVPIAIEGISAMLDNLFIDNLKKCILSWGIEEPSKATRFWSSHIHTDGADEGHWVNTIKMLNKYIKNEHQHQKILKVINIVFDAMDREFCEYVAEPNLSLHVDPKFKVEIQPQPNVH